MKNPDGWSITRVVIHLHRLGHAHAELHLNPDLFVSIEANPDTVVTLTTGAKVLVDETPDEVVELILDWRAGVIAAAVGNGARRPPLALVKGSAGTPHPIRQDEPR